MDAKEKFLHMSNAAREAVEDFRDDLEDKAIVWAAKEIQSIRATTADEIYNMLADWLGNHNVPQNILGEIRKRYGI